MCLGQYSIEALNRQTEQQYVVGVGEFGLQGLRDAAHFGDGGGSIGHQWYGVIAQQIIKLIVETNESKDFTGAGVPTVAAVKKLVGAECEVDRAEIIELWGEFRVEGGSASAWARRS